MHTIWERQRQPGVIRLQDIDPHWWYDRVNQLVSQPQRRILLNPAMVKGKGRPKGAKGKKKGDGESTTRRDPSLFEREAVELPSSTAPARLQTSTNTTKKRKRQPKKEPSPSPPLPTLPPPPIYPLRVPLPTGNKKISATAITILRGTQAKKDTGSGEGVEELSTTALGILRGTGTEKDLYEAGIIRERAYMRSLRIEGLGGAEVEKLDELDGFHLKYTVIEVYAWELYD